MPGPPGVRPPARPRPAFADLTPPLIAPAQGTAAAPLVGVPGTVPVPMPAGPMPGTTVGSSPTGGTPGLPSGSLLPTPMGGGTEVQQSTVVPGQTDPKPAGGADSPTFTVKWNNGLNFVTPDKDWVIHLGGRFQFEPVFWSQPEFLKASAGQRRHPGRHGRERERGRGPGRRHVLPAGAAAVGRDRVRGRRVRP